MPGTINNYGRFIDDERCFELTEEPPRKWVNLHYNCVGEHEIYSEISNIGDGVTWCRDAAGRTCTLVSYDAKYLYIRDDASGTVFCPWGAPAPQEVTDRSCRYYAAKTEITGTCEGLRATQRVFVPHDYVMEVWTLTLENLTDTPREVSVFAYAMFQLTGCDAEGQGIGKSNYAEVMPDIGGVFITNRNTFVPSDRFKGYFVALDGFFNGNGYRDHFTRSEFALGTPKILWGWDCDGQPGYGPDCAGVVQVKLQVPANGSARADFLLGQASSPAEVKAIRNELSPEKLDQLCAEQVAREETRADTFNVSTGDANYDGLINHFVKKQLYSYVINKSGFRDNLQIDCALALADYQAAEDNLLHALASQYANGSVPHGFRPLNRLQYSDKPAWTMMTIPALLKEGGNMALLEAKVPYFESDEQGTVYDHMLRAMRFLANDLGRNGLCLQHHADWNDGLEATPESGVRESIMVTQQLCYGLREVQTLAERIGDTEVAREAADLYATFSQRLNDVAWDGEWYIRTICEDGYRIGSKDNEEGQMFLNPQSWAVLSGIAPDDRAALCMRKVDELLAVDVGYRICTPAFAKYDPRVGRMSNTMPDTNENGGCYNHAAGFKGVADCLLGRAEQAWETFTKVAPDSPDNPVSNSQVEPFSFTNSYSTCKYIYGRAGYPWRTGTAGWFTMLLVEWILGARRDYDGLLVDPCLPKTMKHARVMRTFRGAQYDITIDNSAGRCTGTTSVSIDGMKMDDNVLPMFDTGLHAVEVVI